MNNPNSRVVAISRKIAQDPWLDEFHKAAEQCPDIEYVKDSEKLRIHLASSDELERIPEGFFNQEDLDSLVKRACPDTAEFSADGQFTGKIFSRQSGLVLFEIINSSIFTSDRSFILKALENRTGRKIDTENNLGTELSINAYEYGTSMREKLFRSHERGKYGLFSVAFAYLAHRGQIGNVKEALIDYLPETINFQQISSKVK